MATETFRPVSNAASIQACVYSYKKKKNRNVSSLAAPRCDGHVSIRARTERVASPYRASCDLPTAAYLLIDTDLHERSAKYLTARPLIKFFLETVQATMLFITLLK